ncbi:MAG: hypothetical protein ACPG0L_08840, partial [Bacteroidia bacterium]
TTSNEVIVSENITGNTTWSKDKTYILAGRISVVSGVTLTIEPGTIIKGQAGTGANATALLVARGGKLMAEGTATEPIIFTSVADEIKSGEIASPNLPNDFNGLWGGLIVLGDAPCSLSGDVTEIAIEGVPPTDKNGLYGGTNAEDNSGVIKYVSVRHGGANIGEGNEINGITFGGVGSGTTVENVEVVANQDDGIEWFGGTVNVKNAIVWNAGDDAVDTDQAWAGSLDNFVIICGEDTDHALEIDGPEGSMNAGHTVMNGWVKGHEVSELGDFRKSAQGSFSKIYFFNFDGGMAEGRGDMSLSSGSDVTFGDGSLTFADLEITTDSTDLTKIFKGGTDAHASSVASATNAGADVAPFAGWSWAAKEEAYK